MLVGVWCKGYAVLAGPRLYFTVWSWKTICLLFCTRLTPRTSCRIPWRWSTPAGWSCQTKERRSVGRLPMLRLHEQLQCLYISSLSPGYCIILCSHYTNILLSTYMVPIWGDCPNLKCRYMVPIWEDSSIYSASTWCQSEKITPVHSASVWYQSEKIPQYIVPVHGTNLRRLPQ